MLSLKRRISAYVEARLFFLDNPGLMEKVISALQETLILFVYFVLF